MWLHHSQSRSAGGNYRNWAISTPENLEVDSGVGNGLPVLLIYHLSLLTAEVSETISTISKMARPDEISFFTYSLTRPYPYRWVTLIAIIGGIISLVLVSLLNVATNGFELNTTNEIHRNATISIKQPFKNCSRALPTANPSHPVSLRPYHCRPDYTQTTRPSSTP